MRSFKMSGQTTERFGNPLKGPEEVDGAFSGNENGERQHVAGMDPTTAALQRMVGMLSQSIQQVVQNRRQVVEDTSGVSNRQIKTTTIMKTPTIKIPSYKNFKTSGSPEIG